LITFLVSGLWHGANWTYVLWGGIHGAGQVLERIRNRIFPPKTERSWLRVIITFVFVCFAWIFFRANSLSDAGYIVSNLFTGISNPTAYFLEGFQAFRMASLSQTTGMRALLLCVLCILVLLAHDFLELRTNVWDRLGRYQKPVRYALYFLLLFVVLYSRKLGEYEFVYFQF